MHMFRHFGTNDNRLVHVRRGRSFLGENETLSGEHEGDGEEEGHLQKVWK